MLHWLVFIVAIFYLTGIVCLVSFGVGGLGWFGALCLVSRVGVLPTGRCRDMVCQSTIQVQTRRKFYGLRLSPITDWHCSSTLWNLSIFIYSYFSASSNVAR